MAKFEFLLWLVEFLKRTHFEFQWDKGNQTKSLIKHGITPNEAEEVFYDQDLLPLGIQIQPLPDEIRFGVIGKSNIGNVLFVCFTIRDLEIRVISVRKANKEERDIYEEKHD